MSHLAKAQHLVELMNQINTKINPDWMTAGYPWNTAINVEAAEAADSLPWKWWKHTEADMENLAVELIDIAHFVISKIMISCTDDDRAANFIATDMMLASEEKPSFNLESTLSRLEDLSRLHRTPSVQLQIVLELLFSIGIDLEDFHARFVAKNILNHYRQERGYNDIDGGYVKVFPDGREDNEVFKEVVSNASLSELSVDEMKIILFEDMDNVVKSINFELKLTD